jgi:AraC-like DNA-binding protein
VTVIVRRPGPPLRGLVDAITYQGGEQPRTSVEKILPSPWPSLWINLNRDEFRSYDSSGRGRVVPGAMLAGPASQAAVIEFEQGRAHISVTFAPGAAGCFFGLPLDVARDLQVALGDVWGRPGVVLRERVLEAAGPDRALDVVEEALLGAVAGVPDPLVVAACRLLSAGMPVGKVAADLGVPPRTLRRRFTARVGLGPKRFARVQRLQRVVRELDGCSAVDWAEVAARHGYFDQPHLVEEFGQLAGVTPTEYLRSRVDGPNHLRVAGAAVSSSWTEMAAIATVAVHNHLPH